MGQPGITFELEVRFVGAPRAAAQVKRELRAWLAAHEVTAVVDGFVDGVDTVAGDAAPDDWWGDGDDATPLLVYGTESELKALAAALDVRFDTRIATRLGTLVDTAWQQAWQQEFAGLKTTRFAVALPGEEAVAPTGGIAIAMTGGGAFGGGDHATTEAMLLALEDLTPAGTLASGTTCLDLGTGTGVLAIAAAKLGARGVVGTDLDPDIVAEAAANAAANGVALDLRVTDDVPAGRFDLIMANILVPVLHHLAKPICAAMAPNGTLLLAGFIAKDVPALTATYAALGVQIVAQRDVRGWIALTLRAV